MVSGVRGAGIDVERNPQFLERLLDDVVVTVHDILRGYAFFAGLKGNGHAVLVGAAEEKHLFSVVAEVAGIDVGRDVNTGQVTDMDGAVGVRQRGGDGVTGRIFHVCFYFKRDAQNARLDMVSFVVDA